MNHSQLADLLARTMPHNPVSVPSNRTVETSTLSPRQRFQAHVRTLSDDDSLVSRDTPSPRRSPEVQHVSTLGGKKSESPPPRHPSRPIPSYPFIEPSFGTGRHGFREPDFVVEEREAWAKPSPLRIRKRPSNDVYVLQPPEEDSPVRHPSKQNLKQFRPLAEPADINERPRTSRGPEPSRSSLTLDNDNENGDQEHRNRNSRFAEGSMNHRSGGISSTWAEHGSITSPSATESDNDSTPRPSPQRASIDLDEFKPPATTPATLKQRLFKIGSAFKPNEKATKADTEPHTEKKKGGLRKSMSMWNIHHIGDKAKTRGTSTDEPTPKARIENKAAVQESNGEVLNERKRRAEEAYAQQFGTKRRKSTGGQVAIPDVSTTGASSAEVPPLPLPRSTSRSPGGGRRMRRSSAVYVNTDSELSDSHGDIDHHKRPSRRELEKENQQLRAMLKQQQQDQSRRQPSSSGGLPRTVSTSASLHQLTDSEEMHDNAPRKTSGTKNTSSKTTGKDVPPVPPVHDRVALRTLSNTSNQAKNTNNKANNTTNAGPLNSNASDGSDAVKRAQLPSVVVATFPRPVSMILEEDEEATENKTPTPSPKRRMLEPSSIEKRKVREQIAVQMKGIRREQWEWPEDVF